MFIVVFLLAYVQSITKTLLIALMEMVPEYVLFDHDLNVSGGGHFKKVNYPQPTSRLKTHFETFKSH